MSFLSFLLLEIKLLAVLCWVYLQISSLTLPPPRRTKRRKQ